MTRKTARPMGPWERANRTYSFRVPPDLRDRIEDLRKRFPLKDVLAKGLGLVEAERVPYDKGFEAGRRQGLEEGYREGDAQGWRYALPVLEMPCLRCGKPVRLNMDFGSVREKVTQALQPRHVGDCADEPDSLRDFSLEETER